MHKKTSKYSVGKPSSRFLRSLPSFSQFTESELTELADQTIVEVWEIESQRCPVIKRPPGHFFGSFLPLFISKRAYDRTLGQQLIDMREEYYEALQSGRVKYAHWVHVRGIAGMMQTLVLQWGVSFAKKIVDLWRFTQ